jgi:hypothetical protein
VVVFILEDFEKFTGRRQAVFYNILDTMHGPDIQVSSCRSMLAHERYPMQCQVCARALKVCKSTATVGLPYACA